jgi:hypothetical protein
MKRFAMTAAALSLAGCVAPGQGGYWDNAAHDGSSFERDKAQCIYESKLATASAPSSIFLSQQISQDIATGVRQNELQKSCLEAKGYVWRTR